MTRSALASPGLLAVLTTMMVAAVGCSTPDVDTFDGVNTGSDKDGDRKTNNDNDPKESPAKAKPKPPTTTSTPAPSTTDPAPTAPTTPTTPPTPPPTAAQCFTKCVAPNPTAAAVDTCSNGCPDGDDVCLGNCYFDSGCDVDAACDAAIKTCDAQCPAT